MRRRNDPRYQHCYRSSFEEHEFNERTRPEDRIATERRRRIEDIREAARLEREALHEVWEL